MSTSITGLASGFDSTAYIEAIMKQEKVPLTNLQTKKENTTAYKDFFTTLNTKMATLKDAASALSDSTAFTKNSATSSDTTKMTVTAGDSAVAGSYSVNVTDLAQSSVYQTKASKDIDLSSLAASDKKIQLKISNTEVKEITLTGSTTDEILTNLAKAINQESGAGMTASIIQTGTNEKRLVLTSNETGTENTISFMGTLAVDADGKPTDATALGGTNPVIALSSELKNALGYNESDAQAQEALDAKMTINGVSVKSSSNKVENAIPGVTLTLTDKGSSTVKVTQDTDSIITKINTFVTAYNDIVNTIRNNTTKSTQNDDGTLSLTLQGDPMLRDLMSQLNSWMNTSIGSKQGLNLLSDIGLEIDKGITSASLMTGKITFDSDAFKAKMLEDPAGVQKLLGGTITTTAGAETTTTTGMGDLFKNNLQNWTKSVDGLITSKIKGYDSEISYLSESIQNMSDRLDRREESLKKQYANLEVVMSSLNNQKSYVSSILASFTKSSD